MQIPDIYNVLIMLDCEDKTPKETRKKLVWFHLLIFVKMTANFN